MLTQVELKLNQPYLNKYANSLTNKVPTLFITSNCKRLCTSNFLMPNFKKYGELKLAHKSDSLISQIREGFDLNKKHAVFNPADSPTFFICFCFCFALLCSALLR